MKNRILLSILIAAMIFSCSPQQSSTDWPMFKGNHQRTSYSSDAGTTGIPELIWQADIGSHTPASLSIADGKIFIGHKTGLSCLDLESGQILWEMETTKSVFPSPTYHKGEIYFGSKNGDYYRVNANNGDIIWRTSPT